jgi:chorismate mutase
MDNEDERRSRGSASERDDMAAHVANFKATQGKFQREREEYFAATLIRREENALPF